MTQSLARREFLAGAAGAFAALNGVSCAAPATSQPAAHEILKPETEFNGDSLALDFPALHIGVAEYPNGPTGCTVLHFPKGATAAVDVRGGAPGTITTESLHEGDGFLDAIVLAGGSLYGLEAASGVSAELFARRGYAHGWDDIAVVSGAIIYDFVPRTNSIYPDKALGQAALAAARPGRFPLGRHGAGCSATVGKWLPHPYQWEHAGQGGAFRTIGPIRLAVFTVVNSLGAIIDRMGQVVRGHLDARTGKRVHITEIPPLALTPPPKGNTCLTAVVTNCKLTPAALRQLARQVHGSLARAIEPFNTPVDGDVLYTVTTNEVAGGQVNEFVLAAAASELAWDAVLASCTAQ